MDDSSKLSTNCIAYIALANEYCNEVESARETEKESFVDSMLRLLPRLYISVCDISIIAEDEDVFIENFLDEDYYESIRRNIETLMGPDDIYLEVFEEDMKYSETPIASSISESLSDIYQDLYNFIFSVKDAPTESINNLIYSSKEGFENYWGQKICNVLRALHNLKYNSN